MAQQDISPKNTKNEILEAYQELLKQVDKTSQESYQDTKKKQETAKMVTKASEFTVNKIVNNLTQLKLSANEELDALEQKLTSEYRRLQDLQSAIEIEKANLEELHQIKTNANSLAALLLAQK